jgi:hypothetical protein
MQWFLSLQLMKFFVIESEVVLIGYRHLILICKPSNTLICPNFACSCSSILHNIYSAIKFTEHLERDYLGLKGLTKPSFAIFV